MLYTDALDGFQVHANNQNITKLLSTNLMLCILNVNYKTLKHIRSLQLTNGQPRNLS